MKNLGFVILIPHLIFATIKFGIVLFLKPAATVAGAAVFLPECFGVDFYKHEEIPILRHDSTMKGDSQATELLHPIHSVPSPLSPSILFF